MDINPISHFTHGMGGAAEGNAPNQTLDNIGANIQKLVQKFTNKPGDLLQMDPNQFYGYVESLAPFAKSMGSGVESDLNNLLVSVQNIVNAYANVPNDKVGSFAKSTQYLNLVHELSGPANALESALKSAPPISEDQYKSDLADSLSQIFSTMQEWGFNPNMRPSSPPPYNDNYPPSQDDALRLVGMLNALTFIPQLSQLPGFNDLAEDMSQAAMNWGDPIGPTAYGSAVCDLFEAYRAAESSLPLPPEFMPPPPIPPAA